MWSDAFLGMTISVTKRRKASEYRIEKCSESNRLKSTVSVSYTHLDVYKRQR